MRSAGTLLGVSLGVLVSILPSSAAHAKRARRGSHARHRQSNFATATKVSAVEKRSPESRAEAVTQIEDDEVPGQKKR